MTPLPDHERQAELLRQLEINNARLLKIIATVHGVLELAEAVAEHFDGTDAPLGTKARAVLAQAHAVIMNAETRQ